MLKSRYQPTDEDTLSYINSHLKYRWKMLPECSPQWSVFTVEATHVNASGKYIAAILLLTPEVNVLVSANGHFYPFKVFQKNSI